MAAPSLFAIDIEGVASVHIPGPNQQIAFEAMGNPEMIC
jgi:hypothetical protein